LKTKYHTNVLAWSNRHAATKRGFQIWQSRLCPPPSSSLRFCCAFYLFILYFPPTYFDP